MSPMRALTLAALLIAPSAHARMATRKLLTAFEQGQTEDKLRLAVALGRSKDKRSTELLIEAYDPKGGNPKLTDALTQGLGWSGDPRAVEPLQRAWDYMRTTDMQLE